MTINETEEDVEPSARNILPVLNVSLYIHILYGSYLYMLPQTLIINDLVSNTLQSRYFPIRALVQIIMAY